MLYQNTSYIWRFLSTTSFIYFSFHIIHSKTSHTSRFSQRPTKFGSFDVPRFKTSCSWRFFRMSSYIFPFRHVTFENLSYLSFPLDYLLYFLQFRHNTFQNLLCLAFPLSYLPFFFSFDTLHSKTSHVRRFLSLPHLFIPASTWYIPKLRTCCLLRYISQHTLETLFLLVQCPGKCISLSRADR